MASLMLYSIGLIIFEEGKIINSEDIYMRCGYGIAPDIIVYKNQVKNDSIRAIEKDEFAWILPQINSRRVNIDELTFECEKAGIYLVREGRSINKISSKYFLFSSTAFS